jgi:hypothetical protein
MCGTRLGEPPGESLPRFSRSYGAIAGVRDRARFAVAFVQTLSGARRQLAVIDAELRRLHGERQQLLLAFGDATYRGNEDAAAQTRDRIRAIDERIDHEHEKERSVVEEASRRIDRERGIVAPTEILAEPEADRREAE